MHRNAVKFIFLSLYSIMISLIFVSAINAQDRYEPDNTSNQAMNINVGTGFVDRVIQPMSDEDWFTFLAFSGIPYTLDLKNTGYGDLFMELFPISALGDPIDGVIILGGGFGRETIEFQCHKEGRYYVRVRACDDPQCIVTENTQYMFQLETNTGPQDAKFVGYVRDSKNGTQISGADVISDSGKSCTTPRTANDDPGFYELYVEPTGPGGELEILTRAAGYLPNRIRYQNISSSAVINKDRHLIPADLELAISLLQALTGSPFPMDISNDVNMNHRIGLEEILYVLTITAELR